MTQTHRLSHPTASILGARKWAANSMPRLIFFAIGLHMFFSFTMMEELHRHHHIIDRQIFSKVFYEENDATRPRLHPRKVTLPAFQMDDKEEVDDLYVEHLHHINQELQKTLTIHDSASCRWKNNSYSVYTEDCGYHIAARNGTGRIALFNPMEYSRILCDGTLIAPAGIRVLESGELNCSEPARLFSAVPTIESKAEMDPIRFALSDSQCQGTGSSRSLRRPLPQ